MAFQALFGLEEPSLLRRVLDRLTDPHRDVISSGLLAGMFNVAGQTPEGRAVLLRWALDKWGPLGKALPGREISLVLKLAGSTCGEGSTSDVAAFEARVRHEAEILGMAKDLESQLEAKNRCRAVTDLVAPEVVKYLTDSSRGP